MEIKMEIKPNPIRSGGRWPVTTSHSILTHQKSARVLCVGAPRSPRHCWRRASHRHVSRAFTDRRTGDTWR